jgi:hypothetical protein
MTLRHRCAGRRRRHTAAAPEPPCSRGAVAAAVVVVVAAAADALAEEEQRTVSSTRGDARPLRGATSVIKSINTQHQIAAAHSFIFSRARLVTRGWLIRHCAGFFLMQSSLAGVF